MDPGNDPGRDEYGLPPVDIEIPDDARDLERDVQAYRRELRARRRHTRVRRLTTPLTRHGMVLPLVAACLAVTLLTGTLLTVLSGRQVSLLPGRSAFGTASVRAAPRTPSTKASSVASTAPRTPSTTPPPASGRSELPDVQVTVGSRPVGLRNLAPAVLAWVPKSCLAACEAVLRQLTRQTAAADIAIYFVGTGAAVQELPSLTRQAGLGQDGRVVDSAGALAVYDPMGLTAIFAHADGSVRAHDIMRNLDAASHQPAEVRQFEARLRELVSTSGASEDN